MAATASISIAGAVRGSSTGDKIIGPFNLASAAANPTIQVIVLQSGANTITPPLIPATTGCIIKLPATNTSVVTLKGVTGDTGIALGKTTTQVLNWDATAAPATFVLTSAAAQTGLSTEITFF
mgnify:CR=1 FL=1